MGQTLDQACDARRQDRRVGPAAFAAALAYRHGRRQRAEQRVKALVRRLGPALPLYAKFFRADNATGDKNQGSVSWFERVAGIKRPR